jgi:hypothetical protein
VAHDAFDEESSPASAPAVMRESGLTADHVVETAKALLKNNTKD